MDIFEVERIGRMESELEALTSEIARMSEGQQFLTNVLAKPSPAAIGAPGKPSPPQ